MKANILNPLLIALLAVGFASCSSSDDHGDRATQTKEQKIIIQDITQSDIIGTWKILEQIDDSGDKAPDFTLKSFPDLIFTQDNKYLNKVFTLDHPSPIGNYKIVDNKVKVFERTFQMENGFLVDRGEGIIRYQKQ